MKVFGKLVGYIILAVNFVFTGLLLLSAYSPYINPVKYPVFSCAGLAFPIFLLISIAFLLFWLFIYKRYALLSLIGLLLCFGQIKTYLPFHFRTEEVPEHSFKLLSYNVMGTNFYSKNEDSSILAEYIQNLNPDIICMQEFSRNGKVKQMNEVLKTYPYKAFHKIGQSKSGGVACFSRFPILSSENIEYESTSNGSVIYHLEIEGDTVLLINNHLESNKLTRDDKKIYREMIKSPEAQRVKSGAKLLIKKLAEASAIRAAQVDTIAKTIASSKQHYIIVCGDFNDSPISYAHRIMAQDLNDAFTQSGQGLGISYNQNRFYFRIDNILISKNLQSYNCTVDDKIDVSDHYPIWCYINKEKQ